MYGRMVYIIFFQTRYDRADSRWAHSRSALYILHRYNIRVFVNYVCCVYI